MLIHKKGYLNQDQKPKFNVADKQKPCTEGSGIHPSLRDTTKKSEMPILIEIKLANGLAFHTSFTLNRFISLLKNVNYALNRRRSK